MRWPSNEEDVSVPDDAAILVIARPTNELPDAHAEVLHLYMQGKTRTAATVSKPDACLPWRAGYS